MNNNVINKLLLIINNYLRLLTNKIINNVTISLRDGAWTKPAHAWEVYTLSSRNGIKQQPNGVFPKSFLTNKNKQITKIITKIHSKKIYNSKIPTGVGM